MHVIYHAEPVYPYSMTPVSDVYSETRISISFETAKIALFRALYNRANDLSFI